MNSNTFSAIICSLVLITCTISCSTRGVHDEYFGATEQRLLTHSLDKLVSMLPEKDFLPFKGENIYVECHFIEENIPLEYAVKRIEMELSRKYSCTIVNSPDNARAIYDFFFTALGTDRDNIGFKTPEFVMPGMAGSVSIDLISLDMYHGVSEMYYYITDNNTAQVTRREKIRSVIRTDKLALPVISVPINTLD